MYSKLSGFSPFGSTPGLSRGPGPAKLSPVLGSFKKGGDVAKTGLYKLEAGEKVIPADKRDSEYRRVYLTRKKKKDGKDQK